MSGWPGEFTPEVHQALLKPFRDELVEWRENKFAYIEARAVMSRLDEVVGPGNWSFDYDVVHKDERGAVIGGALTVYGVRKCDVGEHWKASDKDRVEVFKSAVSDALKRCAVHFGVGRYLYHLETARAGKVTPQERDAAARKAGYGGEPACNQPQAGDPEVHDYPCEVCGCDVDWETVGKSRRKFNGRVLCSRDAAVLNEGIKAQPSALVCACGQIVPEKTANASVQGQGRIICVDCQKKRKAAKEKEAVAA